MEIRPFKNQVWENLKGKYNRNNLFEDPLFPTTNKSMYFTQPPPSGVRWKRPSVS